MPLRVCIECGKREMLRRIKNTSPLCTDCNKSAYSKDKQNRRKKNGECLKCGQKLELKKCPHCSGILNDKLTCNYCREKNREKYSSSVQSTHSEDLE
jgi:hypothetical protein